MTWSQTAEKLTGLLGLTSPPVAVSFREQPPPEVPRFDGSVPAGCAFWRLASEGQVFYTEPSDHYGCPVGAHTHGLALEGEPAAQLGQMVQTMVGLSYIAEREVPAIPTLKGGFRIAVYAPLANAPVDPDVVVLRGTPRQLMLAAEASRAAGMEAQLPMRDRPTCAMIPEVLQGGRGQSSLACIGNRVYTGLGDDEFYYAVPGPKVAAFLDSAERIVAANRQLETFHRSRLPAGA
jgi:uncharacterized protein (DUF169 family)